MIPGRPVNVKGKSVQEKLRVHCFFPTRFRVNYRPCIKLPVVSSLTFLHGPFQLRSGQRPQNDELSKGNGTIRFDDRQHPTCNIVDGASLAVLLTPECTKLGKFGREYGKLRRPT